MSKYTHSFQVVTRTEIGDIIRRYEKLGFELVTATAVSGNWTHYTLFFKKRNSLWSRFLELLRLID